MEEKKKEGRKASNSKPWIINRLSHKGWGWRPEVSLFSSMQKKKKEEGIGNKKYI